MSLPCSGSAASRRRVSRAPSPAGVAPPAMKASQRAAAWPASHDALAPVLAGVAGARHEHGRPLPVQLRAVARLQGRESLAEDVAQQFDRVRALDRQHDRLRCDLGGRVAGDGAQPLEVRVGVGGVVDDQPALPGQVVDEDVVLDAPAFVAVERVVGLAHRQGRHVEGRYRAQQRRCLRAPHPGSREVRDIEDAGALAHGLVLGDDALVLEGHLPAGKRREACAERRMALMQG